MDSDEKRARLLEAAVTVLSGAPTHSLGTVALNKALFFLDLVALRETGATATGNSYIALRMGPVVAQYDKRLVGGLVKAGLAKQEQIGNGKPIRALVSLPPTTYLSRELRETARKVGASFAGHTAARLSELSHENVGWQMAYREGMQATGRPRPIDLLVAMQDLPDDGLDPWLEEPWTESEGRALRSSEVAEIWTA